MTNDAGNEEGSSREYVDLTAFGRRWYGFPAGLAEELITLEKEGAVYSEFWDDDAETFRYYRIPLLPKEIVEFVDATWAYQEFNDALAESRAPTLEDGLRGVSNPEIAERARRYADFGQTEMPDGSIVDIRGCLASFYPPGMEALMCGGRPDRYELLPHLGGTRERLSLVVQMINALSAVSRHLSARRRGAVDFVVGNEYDVQDLLYVLVRGVFENARVEEWTPKHAGSGKRVDIVIPGSTASSRLSSSAASATR